MSNRAQRRAMMRSELKRNKQLSLEYEKAVRNAGAKGRIAGLIQNGITPEDVRKEYKRGLQEGFQKAGIAITKSCYAGIILALKEEFGFDEDQCFRAVSALDKKIIWSIDHVELADEVLEQTGLRLELDEPMDRVQKVEAADEIPL